MPLYIFFKDGICIPDSDSKHKKINRTLAGKTLPQVEALLNGRGFERKNTSDWWVDTRNGVACFEPAHVAVSASV